MIGSCQRKYIIDSLVLFLLFLSSLTSCSQESNASQTSLEEDVPIDIGTTEADIDYPKSGPRKGTVVNGEKTKHITLLPRMDVYETREHFRIRRGNARWKNNSKFMIGWGIRNYPEPTNIYITKLITEGSVVGVFALEKHVSTAIRLFIIPNTS